MDIPIELAVIEIERGKIRLTSVEQQMTYGGLMEGVPDTSLNDGIIAQATENAKRRFRFDAVCVVPPRRIAETGEPFPDTPREYLPPVRCTGLFEGPPTTRAVGDWWFTSLPVVWFQDPSDRLVHPDAARQMYSMPWDELARTTRSTTGDETRGWCRTLTR